MNRARSKEMNEPTSRWSGTQPETGMADDLRSNTRKKYRDRIYGSYVYHNALAPPTIEDLKPRGRHIKRLIRNHFPQDRAAQILDLGCGHGAIIHYAHEAGYKCAKGVDASLLQVEAAVGLGIEGVEHGDLMSYLSNTPKNSQDLVISFDVIEHFAKDEMIFFVDNVYRVLKPSGTWILHTCNAEGLFGSSSRYGDFTHEVGFTQRSMGQLLISSGFCDVMSFEDQPVPHGAKSAVRWILWKGIRQILKLLVLIETGSGGVIFSQNFLTVARKSESGER